MCALAADCWLVTHPVNGFWLRGQNLNRVGAGFFGLGSGGRQRPGHGDWTAARDRWEYSHVVRAALGGLSFVALVLVRAS